MEAQLEKECGSRPLESLGEFRAQLSKSPLQSPLIAFLKDPRNRHLVSEGGDIKSIVASAFGGWLQKKLGNG